MSSNPENVQISILRTDSTPKDVMRQLIDNGQEDAFFLCNIGDIMEKYNKWVRAMPRVKPFFAIKTNHIKVVIETLATLGTGFDCASIQEIQKALSLGVSPNRIIFANPTKTLGQLRYAGKVGVLKTTFDNEDELYKFKDVFPQAELVLRIKYDDPNATHILGKKFGADPNKESKQLLYLAKSLNLKVIGVAFHIGSDCVNYMLYQEAIETAKKLFKFASNLGFNFKLLDIGGGFPGNRNNAIFEIGKYINEALDKHFPDKSIQIISEPGRYFVQSAFTLATSIHTTKTVVQRDESNNEHISKMYYVNTSMYQSIMTVLTNESYIPQLLFEKCKEDIYPSIIWGSSCDSGDMLTKSVDLPELQNGDWLYFENVGAYSISLHSEFNGFPATPVHNIISSKDWLLLNEAASLPISEESFMLNSE